MIQVTKDNILNVLFRGLEDGSRYWRVIEDRGYGDFLYLYCDEFGGTWDARADPKRWLSSYDLASVYAHSLLGGTENAIPITPVIRKIRQMERKYANRHNSL